MAILRTFGNVATKQITTEMTVTTHKNGEKKLGNECQIEVKLMIMVFCLTVLFAGPPEVISEIGRYGRMCVRS